MTTEFKDALEEYLRPDCNFSMNTDNAIIRALKIADKLMQEPSVEMGLVGIGVKAHYRGKGISANPKDIFKAMRDQMLTEVE